LRPDTLQDYVSHGSPVALQQSFASAARIVVRTRENRRSSPNDRCPGTYAASLPGFSADRRQALVFIESASDDGAARGHFVLVEKAGDTWRTRASVQPWTAVPQKPF
jgi:hypothetical protein